MILIEREKRIDWICRILMTINVFILVAGYISYFQAKRQLVSPLIPKNILYQILEDGGDIIMKAIFGSAVLFLTGLWFYSFRKKGSCSHSI
jgi:hypothetical protein